MRRVIRKEDIYFLADRSKATHQREVCAKIISEHFSDFDKIVYHDWEILLISVILYGKEIIPVLFLKNKPKDFSEVKDLKIFYPEDILKLI